MISHSETGLNKTAETELEKIHSVYDSINRPIYKYSIRYNGAHGERCKVTQYAYIGNTQHIQYMKEYIGVWDSAWDIFSSTIVPEQVTIFNVTTTYTGIQVTYTNVQGATKYNLYWNTTGNPTTSSNKIADIPSGFIHTGLIAGQTYYYVITAENINGESAVSQTQFSVATAQELPIQPVHYVSVHAFPDEIPYVNLWIQTAGLHDISPGDSVLLNATALWSSEAIAIFKVNNVSGNDIYFEYPHDFHASNFGSHLNGWRTQNAYAAKVVALEKLLVEPPLPQQFSETITVGTRVFSGSRGLYEPNALMYQVVGDFSAAISLYGSVYNHVPFYADGIPFYVFRSLGINTYLVRFRDLVNPGVYGVKSYVTP